MDGQEWTARLTDARAYAKTLVRALVADEHNGHLARCLREEGYV